MISNKQHEQQNKKGKKIEGLGGLETTWLTHVAAVQTAINMRKCQAHACLFSLH